MNLTSEHRLIGSTQVQVDRERGAIVRVGAYRKRGPCRGWWTLSFDDHGGVWTVEHHLS